MTGLKITASTLNQLHQVSAVVGYFSSGGCNHRQYSLCAFVPAYGGMASVAGYRARWFTLHECCYPSHY